MGDKTEGNERKINNVIADGEKDGSILGPGIAYGCHHCGSQYTKLKLLKYHIKKNHLPLQTKGGSLILRGYDEWETLIGVLRRKCQKCEFISLNSLDLMNHKCKYEPNKIYYECPLFDLTPVEPIEVLAGGEDESSRKELFRCEHCHFATIHESGLSRHLSYQHPGLVKKKPYSCSLCPLTYSHQAALKTHIKSSHEKKKTYVCQYCGLALTRSHTLKDHIQVVHLRNQCFSCPHCDYTAPIASYVKAHLRKHGTERPYKCKFCPYSSVRSNTLDSHIRTRHTNDRPHKCNQCDFSCLRPSFLKQHVLAKHTDVRPFACEYCDYKTVRGSHLRSHMVTHFKAAAKLVSKTDLFKTEDENRD